MCIYFHNIYIQELFLICDTQKYANTRNKKLGKSNKKHATVKKIACFFVEYYKNVTHLPQIGAKPVWIN